MAGFYLLATFTSSLQNKFVIVGVLIAAIVSDIFDGVLARRWKCDTENLRKLDSKIDTIFWLSLLYLLVVSQRDFVLQHSIKLFILVLLEILVQLIGYFKFNTTLALHTYSAKFWALLLAVTISALVLGYNVTFLFGACFVWGIISQLEVLLIILKLKTYKVDVKSIYSLITNHSFHKKSQRVVVFLLLGTSCLSAQITPHGNVYAVDEPSLYWTGTIAMSAINLTTTYFNMKKLRKYDKYRSNAIFGAMAGAAQTVIGFSNTNIKFRNEYIPRSINIGIGLTTLVTSIVRFATKNPSKENTFTLNFNCLRDKKLNSSLVGLTYKKQF